MLRSPLAFIQQQKGLSHILPSNYTEWTIYNSLITLINMFKTPGIESRIFFSYFNMKF